MICAVGTSVLLMVGKRLATQVDPLVATWLGYCFSVGIMAVMLVFSGGWPSVTPLFFVLLAATGVLDATAHTLRMYALRRSPLSIVAPIESFAPFFALVTVFLVLHQRPLPRDVLGIVLIVVGAYGLHLDSVQRNWLKPIVKLLSDRGVQLMLLACVIYGITPTIITKAILQTHPVTPLAAAVVSFTFLSVFLWPIAVRRMRSGKRIEFKHLQLAALFGAIASVVTYSGWRAFTLTNPSFVVAVSKMSILFAMIWGAWFFRERVTALRLGSGTVMVAGVVLLVL
jgi:drug/metabolite transporter (DMT)-like permease